MFGIERVRVEGRGGMLQEGGMQLYQGGSQVCGWRAAPGLTPLKLLQAPESDTLQTDTTEVIAAKEAGRGLGEHVTGRGGG